MNKDILLPREIATLKRMREYWQEIRRRDNQTPLINEAHSVNKMLGTRVLDVIEDYLDRLKEDKYERNHSTST